MTQIRQRFHPLEFRREFCVWLTGAILLGSVFGALCAKCLDPDTIRRFQFFSTPTFSNVPLVRRVFRATLFPAFLSLLFVTRNRNGFFLLFFLKGFFLTVVLCGSISAESRRWLSQAAILLENIVSLPALLFIAAVWLGESTQQSQRLSLLIPAICFSILGTLFSALLL